MAAKDGKIMEGENIILRYQLPADVDQFVYGQTHGEWLKYVAHGMGSDRA